jgi:hypothetical protein
VNGYLKTILFLKILVVSLFSTTTYASIEDCSQGYEYLKVKNTDKGIEKLLICTDFLDNQEPKNVNFFIQAQYMLARSYFDKKDYTSFEEHADTINWTISFASLNGTFKNPLTIGELNFIKNTLKSLKPIYRSTLRAVTQINFSLSADNGCDSQGKDVNLLSSEIDYRVQEFESCVEDKNPNFQNILLQNSNSSNCSHIFDKYKDCTILYCNNGSLQVEIPMYETGPKQMTCDADSVAFHRLSSHEKLLSIQDSFLGPVGYELEESASVTPPTKASNPFDMNN